MSVGSLSSIRIKADWLQWPQTRTLVQAFVQAGEELRFVGGAVRDALLDRPVTDVDAATPASPQRVMAVLEGAGIKAVPTGLSHGTITAVVEGMPFEITTLRRDIKTYGRHAEVLFTSDWQEDAARRDFTINALYCDPEGAVYDYFDGVADAHAGVVRFIGDAQKRIAEDGLRILRFFRFSAHYADGQIDTGGLDACRAQKAMLDGLSGERIGAEMKKLLLADQAAQTLRVMQQAGLLDSLLQGTLETDALAVYPTVNLMADALAEPMIALALLVRAQPREQSTQTTAWVQEHWKLSNKEAAFLSALVKGQSIGTELSERKQKKLIRTMGKMVYAALLMISWCERLSESPDQTQMLSANYRGMLSLIHRWQIPIFPLSGEALIERGMKPGPELGEWLQSLEAWWEAEDYQPDEAAILAHFDAQR